MYSNCTNQILLYMKETFIVLIKPTSESQVSVCILYMYIWPAAFHTSVVTFFSYFHLLVQLSRYERKLLSDLFLDQYLQL